MAYSQQQAPTCSCGRILSMHHVSNCYSGRGILCNQCGASLSTGSVWHCTSEFTTAHSLGYDLCLSCGTIEIEFKKQKLYQTANSLHGSKRMQLYHVTDKKGADGIKASGYHMKCGTDGMFGAGIYFAETIESAQYKSKHNGGYLVTAEVAVGRELEVQDYFAGKFTRESLKSKGYDSVNALRGSGTGKPERVVYSGDQVRVLSIRQFNEAY